LFNFLLKSELLVLIYTADGYCLMSCLDLIVFEGEHVLIIESEVLLEGLYHIIQVRTILLESNQFDQVAIGDGTDDLCFRVDVGDRVLGVEVVDILHFLLHLSNNN
jgi:hypothetical protein